MVCVVTILAAAPGTRAADAARPDMEQAKQELMNKATSLYNRGDYAGAIEAWESALTLDPYNGWIKKSIKTAKRELEASDKGDVTLINMANPPSEVVTIWSLDSCIQTAIRNHLPLQIARKNVKLAEWRLFEARRNLLPKAEMKWEETFGEVNGRNYIGKKAYLEGSHTVFKGGELYFTSRQAETNLKIVKEEYGRIKNELVLQVKKNYYTLARAKENARLHREMKKDTDRIYDIVRKGYDMGVITKVDYLNVVSQRHQVDYLVASSEGDVGIAELILKQTMTIDMKEKVDILVDLAFNEVEVDYRHALRAAFINRPEMKINSMMMKYYDYEKKIARAKGLPKVDLMGNWGLAKEEYISIDNGPITNPNTGAVTSDPDRRLEQQWYAGFKVSMPIAGNTAEYSYTREQWVPVVAAFQGTEASTQAVSVKILDNLQYIADQKSSDIDFDRSRQEFIKTKQDVALEVRESCFSYEKALLQLKTAEKKVLYQERDLEIKEYKASMGESLGGSESSGPGGEVIEAMIRLAQEKFSYASALADCHISLATINKAIGIEDYYVMPETSADEGEEEII